MQVLTLKTKQVISQDRTIQSASRLIRLKLWMTVPVRQAPVIEIATAAGVPTMLNQFCIRFVTRSVIQTGSAGWTSSMSARAQDGPRACLVTGLEMQRVSLEQLDIETWTIPDSLTSLTFLLMTQVRFQFSLLFIVLDVSGSSTAGMHQTLAIEDVKASTSKWKHMFGDV